MSQWSLSLSVFSCPTLWFTFPDACLSWPTSLSRSLITVWYSSKAKDKKGQEREEARICERVALANLRGLQERWRLSTPVGDNRKPVWHLLMLVVHTASGKLCETAYIFITASFKKVDSSRISAIFGFHEENQKGFFHEAQVNKAKRCQTKSIEPDLSSPTRHRYILDKEKCDSCVLHLPYDPIVL